MFYFENFFCIVNLFIEPATEQAAPKHRDSVTIAPSPSETIQPPRFSEMLPSMEACDGEELRIPCKVVGFPPPQVSFFKNGKNIDNDEEYVVSYNPDTGRLNSKFHINQHKPEITRNYLIKCNFR